MYLPDQIKYIKTVCKRKNYKFVLYDKHSGYLASVQKNKKKIFLGTGFICSYPINTATAFTISVDKSHTYNILRSSGFNVPTGDYFFLSEKYSLIRGKGKNISDAIKYAKKIGFPVFVKPNDGSRGELAQIIFNTNELIYHLLKISKKHNIGIIQEVISGNEFRIFVIDGKPIFSYMRIKPYLIGDGLFSIRKQLLIINKERIGKGLEKISENNGILLKSLEEKSLCLDDILEIGDKLEYTSSANISGGGEIGKISTKFTDQLNLFCKSLFNITGLRVFAVDLFSNKFITENFENYKIIEINGNPSLSGLEVIGKEELIYNIWDEILEKSFEL